MSALEILVVAVVAVALNWAINNVRDRLDNRVEDLEQRVAELEATVERLQDEHDDEDDDA